MITPLHAQWQVSDVGAYAIAKSTHLKELTQFLEMVSNQVEQINTLKTQLDQVTTYVERFGDPEALKDIVGVEQFQKSISRDGIGKTIADFRNNATGEEALSFTGSGLYQKIPGKTEGQVNVTRDPADYKKFSVVHQANNNYRQVQDDVQERRRELKEGIAETTEALENSTTDAETQKLSGVLVAQAAQLESIDRELNSAAYQAILQDIENRNDEARQSQAVMENHAADREDALIKMRELIIPENTQQPLHFGRSQSSQ
ncbi:MAG: hypothetical protein ACQKBY_08380 [Verrucomicrobiales bacterium]